MPEKRRFMLCVCVFKQNFCVEYTFISVFIAKIESKNDEK